MLGQQCGRPGQLSRQNCDEEHVATVVQFEFVSDSSTASMPAVFAGFSVLYLKEPLAWNHLVGFALIATGAGFIFHRF